MDLSIVIDNLGATLPEKESFESKVLIRIYSLFDVMIEYDNYERAVIVTGDGDFYCLVEYLKRKDKLLKLLVPDVQRYSGLLKQAAPNNMDFMNNLKKKLELKINESQLHKDQPL